MGMFKSSVVSNFDTIYVQDFGDDYHHPYFSDDEDGDIRKAAKGIMSQYANIDEYEQAMEIYKLYMEDLVERCGGKVNFDVYKESNSIPFFVPPKPKLKQTVENEMYKKYGLANYGFVGRSNITKQRTMAQQALEFFREVDPQIENIDDYNLEVKTPENGMKLEELEMINMVVDREENNPIYKAKPSSLDMMVGFFDKGFSNGGNNGKAMVGRTTPPPISEEKLDPYIVPSLAQLASYDFNPDNFYKTKSELLAERHKKETIGNSSFNLSVSKEDKAKAEFIQDLQAYGWDPDFMIKQVDKDSALGTYLSEEKRLEELARNRDRRKMDKQIERMEDMIDKELYNTMDMYGSYEDDAFNSNYMGDTTEI